MNSSFYNGISGSKTHQFGIDVWGDNIANVSTTGFKGSTPEFSTIFATKMAGNYFEGTSNDVSYGSRPSANAIDIKQGTFQNTDNVFDLALGGEGWFGVKGVDNQPYYTRAGSFSLDANGDMVDPSGNYLLGTLGGNIAPTTLPQEKLETFGKYQNNGAVSYTQAYSIAALQDIQLGPVASQSPINLPEVLYMPPEPSTYIDYQANLNPEILTETTYLDQEAAQNITMETTGHLTTIAGTLANETEPNNLKAGDKVYLTVLDEAKNSVRLEGVLDDTLSWSIENANISSLETDGDLRIDDRIEVVQEIPNQERFTTEIIAPDGNKDVVEMMFTKHVPQGPEQTVWDVDIQILRYAEPYVVEFYDPDKTYDEDIYEINEETEQVFKRYDAEAYVVDKGNKKVYEIIDAQTGSATFSGGGQLLASDIPVLSNSGVPLDLSIGEPFESAPVNVTGTQRDGDDLIISGTAAGVPEGKSVVVDVRDENGEVISTAAKVNADGSWQITYPDHPFDEDAQLQSSAYRIINNGYEGMVSHVDLEKSRIADKDGHPEGYLKDYGMDGRGNVIAEFSNGRSSPVAKIAVYHFQNDQGLTRSTSTLFQASSNSGEPIFYTDANGNFIQGSAVYANRLENSNVNLGTALTELIVLQKAFDASAKSITTSDEMIRNAIQMKR